MTALCPKHLVDVSSVEFYGRRTVRLEGDRRRTFSVKSPIKTADYCVANRIAVIGKFMPADTYPQDKVDYVDTLVAPVLDTDTYVTPEGLRFTPCLRCDRPSLAEYCLDCTLLRSDELMRICTTDYTPVVSNDAFLVDGKDPYIDELGC